ncbi:hypothetical protein CBR_g11875 [Chara braunii]|uniref:Uncharacterized protein n=1 Tax=Chara braunii TaxID=69332 RepID=A0A388JS95_CHABU|nr:hypothetical protein CBR_g11875 [Chara braunii]|eukprot:GBG60650.1 hypothetical protein CBR_g11875 [Chara braunii]
MLPSINLNNLQVSNQSKLAAEKSALVQTVKSLNREVAKLEKVRKTLDQPIGDEEEASGPDSGTAPPSKALSPETGTKDVRTFSSYASTGTGGMRPRIAASPKRTMRSSFRSFSSPTREDQSAREEEQSGDV